MEGIHYEVAVLTTYTRAPASISPPADHQPSATPECHKLSFPSYENSSHFSPFPTPGDNTQKTAYLSCSDSQKSKTSFSCLDLAQIVEDFHTTGNVFSASESSEGLSRLPSWVSDLGQECNHSPFETCRLPNNSLPSVIDSQGSVFVDYYTTDKEHDSENCAVVDGFGKEAFEANLERIASDIYNAGMQLSESRSQPCLSTQTCSLPEEDSTASYRSARSSISVDPMTYDVGDQWLMARSGSQSDISELNSDTGSEDNFADVESSDKSTNASIKTVAKHLKKVSQLRKFKTPLETIFSPSIIKVEALSLLGCTDENVSPLIYRDESFIELTDENPMEENEAKAVRNISFITSGAGSSISGTDAESQKTSSGYHESSEGETNVELSSLNPNCQPFVPRAHRTLNDSGFHNVTNTTQHTVFSNSYSSFTKFTETETCTDNELSYFSYTEPMHTGSFTKSSTETEAYTDVESCFFSVSEPIHSHSYKDTAQTESCTESQPCYFNFSEPEQTDVSVTAKTSPDTSIALYLCPVDHKDDFIPIPSFSINNLPDTCRTLSALETMLSISQRVVRIEIKKPQQFYNRKLDDRFGLVNSVSKRCTSRKIGDIEDEELDHLATGFVHFINEKTIEIQTQSAVLNNSDISNVKVTFDLYISKEKIIEITCMGGKELNFNSHSKTCTFQCDTPNSLVPYLIHFKEYPVALRSSFFNDSSYFTDSSPDTSVNHHDNFIEKATTVYSYAQAAMKALKTDTSEVSNFQCIKHIGEAERSINCMEHKRQILLENNDSSSAVCNDTEFDLLSDPPLWANEDLPTNADFEFTTSLEDYENPFGYCKVPEDVVKKAFFSVPGDPFLGDAQTECGLISKDLPDWDPNPSLLDVVEKRLGQNKGNYCPYQIEQRFEGAGLYTPFSSHAGDLFTQWSPLIGQAKDTTNLLSQRQDYEGLLYAQNNQREEYNKLYKSSTHWDLPSAVEEGNDEKENDESMTSEPTGDDLQTNEEMLAEKSLDGKSSDKSECSNHVCGNYGDFSDYIDSWDRDLLNLDENLNLLPEYMCFENLMSEILDEGASGENCVCAKKSSPKKGAYSVIISYPHGGPKSVSIGRFSQHNHVGGDLYDTPTCVGCCGAPVLALHPDTGSVQVMPLLHAGTTSIKGLPTGVASPTFW